MIKVSRSFLEYINLADLLCSSILLCILMVSLLYIYIKLRKYLPLIKMAETAIDSLIRYDKGQQELPKKQKLLECVLTGNSRLYLSKVYTEEQINKLNAEEVEKLFSVYEAKLSGQMVKSLGKSIIHMYSMGACAALGIKNQDALSDDLENDPFLNSALQRFTCDLYYRFGSLLAPLSVGLITGRHYVAEAGWNEVAASDAHKKKIIDNKNGGTEIPNDSSNDKGPQKS